MALDATVIFACSVVLYGICAQTEIPSTCNDPLTPSLRDDQFTASSKYDEQHGASFARFNSSVGWIAGSNNNEYLKVSLDGVWRITALDFADSNFRWPLNYLRVSYSLDGYQWDAYNTRLSRDSLGKKFPRQGSVTKLTLDPPIEVRYLAFYGASAYGYPSIRLELYGCQISATPFSGKVTQVTDDIQADTTWIPSQNPFVISRQVNVRPEVTLTVQAGVNVIFTSKTARLDIFGTLVSEGLPEIRTHFSSDIPMMETSSLWLGIKQFSGGNVTLRHTTVRQAVVGIQGNGSNIHISNSDIYSCVQGLLLSGGISANQLESGWGPILFKTKVTNNEQGTRMHGVLGQEIMLFEATDFDLNNYGIEVENWANIQTQIISTILLSENVSMSNNRNYGLYIKIGSPTVVDVRGSMFVGNRNGGVYWYQYYTNNPRQAFTITDTLFEDTNFGISYTCNYCRTSNMTVTIASNTFNDNKRDIYITFHSSEQSFIVQNVFSKSQEVLAIQSDTSMETNISVIISENSFVNLLRGYTAVSVSFVKTIISKNSFNNCSSTTLISVKNGFDHLIANNTFVNSTDSICYVQTKQPYTKGKTISASLNYWDTNDIFAVKSKVCDFFVDSSTAIIDVKGFYEDFSMKKLNYSKAIDMFRSAINETTNITYIGGIVDDDIDISTLGVSRFMLNRSLLIQEGVTVRIQGVTLNITDVKGIVVLGTLVIGSSDSVDRTVIQKHSGVWNSIVLYNTGLNVLNTNISGAVAAIDIRSSSSVYIHNCTAYDGAMQSLIKADKPKHNVSVHISNCIVSVDANVIEIVVNDSQSIDVNIENSTMTSNRNYIVSVTDGSSNRSPKLVRVSVLGSHSYGGVGVLNIRGCFFRTELTIVDSEFAATRYGTLVSLANPSMKTEAHRNKFGDSRRDFYLEFCKPLTDVMNNSTTFNMVNNIFKSQSDGEVFYMYDYSGATEHTFNFTNNSMVYMQPTARQFLFITSYGNSEKHTLNFISNTLVNSSKTLLEIHHRFRQITLKWNKFINNSACLLYSAPPHTDKFLGFEIDRNEFQGNTHIDGIIVISTEQFQNGTVSLTNNDFINNMGTSFSFKTSNVSIKYNYFENPEALYNLKVNKFVTLTNVRTDINASFNYWGTTDPRDIENKLYDKSYDETLLDILYRPYLGSRNISDFRNEEINFVNGNEIGGNVNGDVTLHSDKGPYVVVSNIVVGENDTLTIQEGVEIRVMADIGFTVLGILISQGTSQRPVRFISVDHLAPWKGIELNSKHGVNITHLLVNNTKEGITLKTTKATLHDVTSTFSRTSGFYIFATDNKQNVTAVSVSKLNASNNADGVTINAGTGYNNYISILNCIVADNKADGIVTMSTGNVTISKCTIERNKARGMKLDMRTNGFIKVVKSLIRNNSEYALEGEVTAGIEMDSCTISDHRLGYNNWGWYPRVHTHLRISASNSKLTTVDIKNSIITNNTADGILLTRSYNNRGPLAITVDNNTFNIGNVAFEFNDEHNYGSSFFNNITFVNNTMSNYTENHRQKAVVKFRLTTYDNISINQNRFANNTGYYGIRIEDVYGRAYVNMSFNTFLSNMFATSTIDIPFATKLDMQNNVFEALAHPSCALQAPGFEISYSINAIHNYWGSKNLSEIVNTICGFEKNMGLSYVSYIPYYGDNMLTQLTSPENFNKSSAHGTFGGEITRNTQLAKSDFPIPILIQRSIVIRPGVSLYVETGVELRFLPYRGIYVQGSLKSIGENSSVRLTNAIDGHIWYGVIINGTSSLENDNTLLFDTHISGTFHGVITYVPHFQIKRIFISNSSKDCFTIYPTVEKRLYSFESSILAHCRNNGLFVNGIGSSIIEGLEVRNSSTGVKVSSSSGQIELRTVLISNISAAAVSITYNSNSESGNVSITNCAINNSSQGVIIDISNYATPNRISITNNVFQNISWDVLHLRFSTYTYYNKRNRSVEIDHNTFTNSCGIIINTWNVEQTSFSNNVMKDSICNKRPECFSTITASGYSHTSDNRNYEISTNVFENIQSSSCIVHLLDSDLPRFNGAFIYNQLIDNKATDGVVLANAFYAEIVENIFDNPASTFDVFTTLKADRNLNVTKNWWGNSDGIKVFSRISDQRRDPGLARFNVTPTLASREMDCSGVNNCSNQGECVRKNMCRCTTGWTGPMCTEYDCAGINRCYGNGICVGPNECECNLGWSGKLCIRASCINVNDCSGHGFCIRPDTCTCAVSFTGSNCSSCVPLHWGQECRPCPNCKHGQCDLMTGLCVCNTDNWTGALCDKCSEAFYGPECLPLVTVLDVVPRQGIDKGGNTVHVWGHNFQESSSYVCKFGNVISNGTWKAWDHVVCVAPKHPEGVVTVEISQDGVHFTNNKIMYAFYASCPIEACGRNLNPPHGLCIFGVCSCILPWHGDNCTMELLRPVIARPPVPQAANEFDDYMLELGLTQGDQPVRWALLEGFKGLSLDERSGRVSWKSIPANINPYIFRVQASNTIGQDTVTWNLSVPISYVPFVNESDSNRILPYPRPVQISGYINFTSKVKMVPVMIVVINARTGEQTVLNEWSNPLKPSVFTTTYYPKADESGLFNVIARHPGSRSDLGPQISWSVLGMQCIPPSVNVDETILSPDGTVTVYNISELLNVGEYNINNILIKVDGIEDTFIKRNVDNVIAVADIAVLKPRDPFLFDLVIRNARPLYGTIYIVFASDHGTTTRLRINIRLSIQKPVLSFLPNSISANILRGTQRFFNIGIKNIGKVAATNIDISLPNDPRITLVSLSLVNSSEDVVTGDKLGIPPDGEAQMTFGVTIGSNAALGEFHGTIYVNSKLTSTPLQYEFFVTSLQRFNLTFTIKDEYTYFAEGSPLVSGAKVSLSNPRRQYAQTFYTTNETGYVVFENLYEDRYTFRAEADGHGSYSAVIIAGANETHRDIFLQRIAVKYTWTVTPTTFQDKYIIQLESTFETNVPMPVVTIEPSHINTIPYEIGEEDTINFKITNHGLIRANNVRFSLPEGHPYLKFKTVIDDIGSVEANTSIIVPIEATLKTRPKRNIVAAVICGLAMLYDYDCGALQTRAIDISLVRETPDGRPMPCGLSSGGGGRGVGGGISLSGGGANTGSGSSVEYSPTTPLSCDCAKTLIKSCALAYHPIIGCSYAITDLGLSYAKSNGDFILFTLYAILAIADTAMACVFGVICSLCGVMYTTVRCIGDVVDNCDVGRRRREISSDVVNNMMQTSKPIGNFLQIMSEFFGDEAMFDVETSWFQTFKQTVADDTDLGQMLSEQERTSIINFVKNETSKAIMSRFLERWNNTASAWNNGSLTELEDTGGVISLSRLKPKIQQYQTDTDAALAKGYANIFFQYDNASSVYKQAEEKERSEGGSKEDGVCARVRVRILQELVLIRDAFTARLEMENGENSDLQNIKVQIEIRPTYGSSANYIDKFSIGKPTLIGLSGVDGTGSLQKDTSGSAEWLIIPYSTAAPQDDTQYDVGGTLSYSVGGSEFALPLLPDTITVKPNPSLIVHYFHEKYVQGDNPMTQTVEPVVPFSLAVMVMNKGFGIARALKITSGQPEIIENDKGLLVSFEIIGAQMGSNSITPSLTVDFGDITSSQTKTARWLMTSSLMGKFYNYSATFENINPLGDPQLSLLDDLGYHELFHLVRIENADKDDGLDDFLVNDFIDIDDIPDRLYNSYSGLDVMAVTHANITNVTAPSFVRSMNKSYTNITIIIQKHVSNWIYSRLENTFRPNEKLIYAEAVDGHRPLLLQKNVWQTTYIKNKTLIHLFDYVSNSSNMSSDTTYQLTYGSENMYAPKFNMTSLVQEVRRVTPVGSTVLNVVTYDLDNDEIDILMMSNTTVFMIKKTSSSTASLTVVTPLNPGVFVIALLARDHGIPPKTSLANVSLTITDDINTTTPVFSSQSATSTTETSTVSSNASSTALKTATPSETITSTEPSTNVTIPTTDYTKDGSTRMSTTGEMSTSTNSNVSSSSTIAKTNATVSTTTTYQTTDTPTLSPTTHDLYTTRDPTGGNLSTSTKPSTTNATGTSSTSTESTSTKSVSTTQNISTTTGEFTTSNVFSVSTRSTNITSTVPNQGSVFAYSIVPTVIGCAVGVIVFWPLL